MSYFSNLQRCLPSHAYWQVKHIPSLLPPKSTYSCGRFVNSFMKLPAAFAFLSLSLHCHVHLAICSFCISTFTMQQGKWAYYINVGSVRRRCENNKRSVPTKIISQASYRYSWIFLQIIYTACSTWQQVEFFLSLIVVVFFHFQILMTCTPNKCLYRFIWTEQMPGPFGLIPFSCISITAKTFPHQAELLIASRWCLLERASFLCWRFPLNKHWNNAFFIYFFSFSLDALLDVVWFVF